MNFVDSYVRSLLTWDVLVFFHRNPDAVLDLDGLAVAARQAAGGAAARDRRAVQGQDPAVRGRADPLPARRPSCGSRSRSSPRRARSAAGGSRSSRSCCTRSIRTSRDAPLTGRAGSRPAARSTRVSPAPVRTGNVAPWAATSARSSPSSFSSSLQGYFVAAEIALVSARRSALQARPRRGRAARGPRCGCSRIRPGCSRRSPWRSRSSASPPRRRPRSRSRSR